ncbi:MAG: XRE family transcriptional regulator [Saprospiraceae bacterium]|nr:XRE family transcriptional regulator [Saprospiraceae bacterium]
MNSLGEKLRKLREEKKLPLRKVAAFLDMDQAILSKIERGLRPVNREMVLKLASYYAVAEKELLVAWLSEKLLRELDGEDNAVEALQAAEEQMAYKTFLKIDRNEILKELKTVLSKFTSIKKAWIFGSFARQEVTPGSDIDVAIEADSSFGYFELADLQHEAEKVINRKVDVGFMDSFKP